MCPDLKALRKHSRTSQVFPQPHQSHAIRYPVTIIYKESSSREVIRVFLDVFQHNLTAGNKVSQHYVINQLANSPRADLGNQLCWIRQWTRTHLFVHTKMQRKSLPARLQCSFVSLVTRTQVLVRIQAVHQQMQLKDTKSKRMHCYYKEKNYFTHL